jgi:hypothetical protein
VELSGQAARRSSILRPLSQGSSEQVIRVAAKYDFEVIKDASVTSGPTPGFRYRIRDIASDNALASCYDRLNAQLIVDSLNATGVEYMSFMRKMVQGGK